MTGSRMSCCSFFHGGSAYYSEYIHAQSTAAYCCLEAHSKSLNAMLVHSLALFIGYKYVPLLWFGAAAIMMTQ